MNTYDEIKILNKNKSRLIIASCHNGNNIANNIIKHIDKNIKSQRLNLTYEYIPNIDFQFSDGEKCAEIEINPENENVIIIQSLNDPTGNKVVDENIMSLLAVARLFKENGAKKIIVIIPYLAYTRQDKCDFEKYQPITVKLLADLYYCAGIDNIITWHTGAEHIRGFFGQTILKILNPFDLYANVFAQYKSMDNVVMLAPDRGAEKYALKLAQSLDLNCAYAVKERINSNDVAIHNIVLEKGRYDTAIIFDNLIYNGETLRSVTEKLVKEYKINNIIIGVSHSLCTYRGINNLIYMNKELCLKKIIITDSIDQLTCIDSLQFIEKRSIANEFASYLCDFYYDF